MAAGPDFFTIPLQEPVVIFAVIMTTILVVPLIAARIRLPAIVVMILVGMVLGPDGTQLLQTEGTITLWGTVGLQYIMFLAGLEIDVVEFNKSQLRSVFLGLMTFLFPAVVVGAVGHWLLDYGWSASLLLASMFGAHTLLAYPLVSRMGLGKQESVTITVGATIIAEIAALVLLAAVSGIHSGDASLLFWGHMLLRMSLFGLFIFLVVPRVTRAFFKHVGGDGGHQFLFVLVVVFVCAVLSVPAKLEPIIGAFLAGLAVNRLIPENGPLANRLEFVGQHLFIPVFLLWVGMIVDLDALISSWKPWAIAGVLVVPALGAKLLAAKITQWRFGYTANEGWVMFGLSASRAAATLAVVLVGQRLGVLDGDLVNAVVILIVVSCLVSPWVAEHFGRRAAIHFHRLAPPVRERQLSGALGQPEDGRNHG
jgi:Kef-type K+ transport system membrane component KefB